MKNNYSTTWFKTFLEPITRDQSKIEIDFLIRFLPNPPYQHILDVCCGQGRHSNLLATRGHQITGIDLNQEALDKAKKASNDNASYHNMDMRCLNDLQDSFDAIINLWQSFGYFDDATNKDILRQMSSKLNPKGRLILDIYNRGFFEKHQGERKYEKTGMNISETKIVSDNRLSVELDYGSEKGLDRFDWRLYTPTEIKEMAEEVGLVVIVVCTDFDEGKQATDMSPRMQIVCEKTAYA